MKTTAQSPQSKSGSTKRRRWLQVSLRTICLGFLLVALLSVYLGRPSVGYYHDRKVADRIEALGGTCEWMAFPPSFGSAPDRLLTRMGVKAVIDRTLGIVHARLVRVEVRSGQVSMEDVELLSTCEELRDLVLINVGLTNEMVAVIGLSDSIESLDIRRNSSVTDAAVDGLSGIPALELTGTKISYAAHKKLAERKIARMTSESGLLNGRALGELYAYSNDVAIALLKSPEAPDGIDAVLVRLDGVQHKASSWGPLMLRRAERLGYSIDELMAWWSEDHVINGVLGAGTVGDKECLTFPRLEIDASQLTAARYQVLKSGAKPDCLVVYVDVADIETMQRITQLSARTLALCGELDQEACGHLITSLHATPSTETLVIRDAEISNENAQRLQAIESLKHLAIPGANISEQEVRAWKDDRYFPLESLVLPEALAATKDELLDKRIALQIEFSPPGKPTVPRGSP